MPTMFVVSSGLTSIHGSTSLFMNTCPDWAATLSAVQAANGLTPEVCTSGPGDTGPASAGCTPTASAVLATNAVSRRFNRNPPFPSNPQGRETLIRGAQVQYVGRARMDRVTVRLGQPTSRKPPFKFSAFTRVGFSDTDAQGIVYYGRYLPYFDHARVEYHRHIGHADLGGNEFVMRASNVEYHAPARFDDLLEVFVRVERIGTTSVMYDLAAYRVEDGDEDVL